jgi:hypothetical protein
LTSTATAFRATTLLIDSEQLESGQALEKDFREMAADEIDRFRREIIERTGDIRAADDITEQDLLRECSVSRSALVVRSCRGTPSEYRHRE